MKRRHVDVKDNAYLCELDMSHATKEEKIAWLIQMTNNELDKGAAADEQLLLSCSEYLEELAPETVLSAEEVEAYLQAMLAAAPSKKKKTGRSHVGIDVPPYVKYVFKRITALAAIFALAILMIPQVYAQTIEQHDEALLEKGVVLHDFLQPHVDELSTKAQTGGEEEPVEVIEEDAEPYQCIYRSWEEFLANEDRDFVHPVKLPEGIEVDYVIMRQYTSAFWSITFKFNEHSFYEYTVTRHTELVEKPRWANFDYEKDDIMIADNRAYRISQKSGEDASAEGIRAHVICQSENTEEYLAYLYIGHFRYTVRVFGYDLLQEALLLLFGEGT